LKRVLGVEREFFRFTKMEACFLLERGRGFEREERKSKRKQRRKRRERDEGAMKMDCESVEYLSWNCINGNLTALLSEVGCMACCDPFFFSSFMKEKIKVKVITDECL
jgi:hypothetical protein